MIIAIPPRLSYGQDEVAFWDGFLTEEEINFLLAQPVLGVLMVRWLTRVFGRQVLAG